MKTTIEAKTLARIIKQAGCSVRNRHTLPILANLLVAVPDSRDTLSVTGTDLDVTTRVTIPTVATEAGCITAPKSRLEAAAKACKGLTALSFQDAKFSVVNGSQFTLDTLPADEFPLATSFQDAKICAFQSADFLRALKLISFAQSTDESRYVLNGVCLELSPEAARIVASDGRRLAHTEIEYTAGAPLVAPKSFPREEKELRNAVHAAFCGGKPVAEFPRVQAALKHLRKLRGQFCERETLIIPAKAVAILEKLLPVKGDGVTVGVQWLSGRENDTAPLRPVSARFHWTVAGETFEVVTKLIDGNFPNWRQVIPADFKERIQFDRAELLAALQAAETMTTEKANSVKLQFGLHTCSVCTNAPELGEFRKDVAINYTGKAFSIAFNPGYLIEALSAVKDNQTVCAEFTDELCPGVFTLPGTPWQTVVMPMRLS